MKHRLTAWMDGFQRHVFCQTCGKDDPPESEECPGVHPSEIEKIKEPSPKFVSGLADK